MYNAARPFTFARYLGIEFATELIEAILVVFLLAQTNITSFGGKVGFVLTAGTLAALATNVSYWNSYGFPANYTAAYMFIQIVQFFLVGVIAGLILRPKNPASA